MADRETTNGRELDEAEDAREQLDELRQALAQLTDPEALEGLTPAGLERTRAQALEELDVLFFTARRAAEKPVAPDAVDYPSLVAMNVRRARGASNLTQEDLAREMSDWGFDWKRITVAEVERSHTPRRLSFDELVGLAVVLRRPVAWFLLSHGHPVSLELGLGTTKAHQLNLLVMGGNARIGELSVRALDHALGMSPSDLEQSEDPLKEEGAQTKSKGQKR